MRRTLAMVMSVGWISVAHAATTVDSHTLFLNNCQPNGCTVHRGNTDATTDTSDIPGNTSSIASFSQSATVWADVMSCMKTVMAPFDLTVTDQRPASGPYFEVIVAGTSTEIGFPSSVANTADVSCQSPGACTPYISKEVAFAFANENFFANDPDEICAAAAQAIASSWTLDRVVDASDVMTYNSFTGLRSFHDNEACGSDCVGGQSPFGLTCTGTNQSTATHTCIGSGAATQNEIQMLLALFGPARATPDGGVDGGQVDGDADGDASGGAGGVGAGGAAGMSAGDAAVVDAAMSDAPAPDASPATSEGGQEAGGASACEVNADCALGLYCETTSKMCTFDCRVAADCASGSTCNSLGMCVAKAASAGGCGCRVGDGTGSAAAPGIGLLIALAALRRPSRRRRRAR